MDKTQMITCYKAGKIVISCPEPPSQNEYGSHNVAKTLLKVTTNTNTNKPQDDSLSYIKRSAPSLKKEEHYALNIA
jgi:hypothetical protein